MAEETVHYVDVQLTREKPPIRRAVLEMTGDEVVFGTPAGRASTTASPRVASRSTRARSTTSSPPWAAA